MQRGEIGPNRDGTVIFVIGIRHGIVQREIFGPGFGRIVLFFIGIRYVRIVIHVRRAFEIFLKIFGFIWYIQSKRIVIHGGVTMRHARRGFDHIPGGG